VGLPGFWKGRLLSYLPALPLQMFNVLTGGILTIDLVIAM
jgi:hypothetical protein